MNRKLIVAAIFILVCCALVWFFRHWLSMDRLVANDVWLRDYVEQHPFKSCLIGFAIYLAASLVPGTGGKSVIFGWIFGTVAGATIIVFALTTAASVSFCLSRYVLYDIVHRRFSAYIAYIDSALRRDGAFYLFALRVVHCPYTLTNYAMGATKIRLRSFVVATFLGLLPGVTVFAYAGSQLPTLTTLAEQGVMGVVSFNLIVAVALISLAPIAIRFAMKRLGWLRTAPQSD